MVRTRSGWGHNALNTDNEPGNYVKVQYFLTRIRKLYLKRAIGCPDYMRLRRMALDGQKQEAEEELAEIVEALEGNVKRN